MKKLLSLTALAFVIALPTFAQRAPRAASQNFASDLQTLPVVANVPGVGSTFQSYLSILNPTASAFTVTASFYDSNGTKKTASINLAAGEVKVYQNFLQEVFQSTGGGGVTFSAPESTGGQHNNRFIIDSEVWTSGTRYGASIPTVEFAGSNSRSFTGGISVDTGHRTNAGCFNQSSVANKVTIKVLDASGKNTVGNAEINLAANGWGQVPILSVVTGGTLQFDPAEAVVCYASVVDNSTNDARFQVATEYLP